MYGSFALRPGRQASEDFDVSDPGKERRMNKWEYKVISLSDADPRSLESKLNELGVEGWEVVAYVGHEKLDSIVLKCQKQHEVHHDSEPAVF
jgi:hypothetical protein